jgi:hypothetical protein
VSNIYGEIPDLGRAVYIEGMPSTLISLGVLQDRGFKAKLDDNMSFELSNGDIKLKFDKNESNVWAGDFINEYECIACDAEGNERSTTSQEEIKFKLMDALHQHLEVLRQVRLVQNL